MAGIRHRDDLVENYDLLWETVQQKAKEIEQEFKDAGTWHGSSSGPAFTTFESVGTRLRVELPDGTSKVFLLMANSVVKARDGKPHVTVEKFHSNAEWYWEPMIADAAMAEKRVVVDHIHYTLGKNGAKPGPYNGYGGRRWDIEFFDGRAVTTYDLWHQGPIPPAFWEQLPDNARFLPQPPVAPLTMPVTEKAA